MQKMVDAKLKYFNKDKCTDQCKVLKIYESRLLIEELFSIADYVEVNNKKVAKLTFS